MLSMEHKTLLNLKLNIFIMNLNIEKLASNSRNGEIADIVTRIVSLSKDFDWSTDQHLAAMLVQLNALHERFKIALSRDTILSNLEELDEIRDDYVRDLYYMLQGAVHNPKPTIKAAGVELFAIFEKYGLEIINMSYAMESSLLTSLITDFSEKSIKDLFKSIDGMSEIFALVTKAQDNFEKARVNYERMRVEDNQESATIVKKESLELLNGTLVTYLKTMAMINEPVYGNYANTIALMFKENNEQVKRRKKKPTTTEE